jgi:hypothetical protein
VAAGIALATAFGAALAGEATVAGDAAARQELAGLSANERTVRVTRPGPASTTVDLTARRLLDRLGLGTQTRAVLLNPVRLDDTVVRPAAISRLHRWTTPARDVGACRAPSCPLLLAGGPRPPSSLAGARVHLRVVGGTRLRSAAALGFVPHASRGPARMLGAEPPLLVGGDPGGLDRLPGLRGIYRTDAWSAQLPVEGFDSWDLAGVRDRLQRADARLVSGDSAFVVEAPIHRLAEASAQARSAPRRMLLVAGGGLAVLAVFVVLVAGALRADVGSELARMRIAGATRAQRALFAFAEAAVPSATGITVGAAGGVVATAVLAATSGVPVAGALLHSLVTPLGAAVAVGGFVLATLLLGALLLIPPAAAAGRRLRLADLLAVSAAAALALAAARGGSGSASDPLPILLVPLSCLAAGVLAFRLAGAILRGAERLSRVAPLGVRLALVNLARAPSGPSLAVAFLTITVALGGFAIVYRATLLRGVADQAADRVPLDATVAAGRTFVTPLQAAPVSRWRALASGQVLPVDRTEASYPSTGETTTVPAIGLPARGLELLHGWRAGDGSAPPTVLARRLRWSGRARNPGPLLPRAAESLSANVSASTAGVAIMAELRNRDGVVRELALGDARPAPSRLRAPLPRGRWELAALELDEPAGLEITNGHQLAEGSGAGTTPFSARVRVRSIQALGPDGREPLPIAGWRAVGAAGKGRPAGAGLSVRFTTSGAAGVLRSPQPSDSRLLPILVDPDTAAAAGPGGRLPLTVDGVALRTRVVGVLKRFPTLAADAAGFVVADQAQLEGAVAAAQPGAGQANELWLRTADSSRLRAALSSPRFRELSVAFRSDIERALRSDPIARGVLGGLIAAGAISLVIACVGLVVLLFGSGRDRAIERDLAAQGLGPRALRADLRLRTAAVAALGVLAGLVVAIALVDVAVGAVHAATTLAAPRPPLVTVVPWAALLAWSLAVAVAVALAAWIAGAGPARTR